MEGWGYAVHRGKERVRTRVLQYVLDGDIVLATIPVGRLPGI